MDQKDEIELTRMGLGAGPGWFDGPANMRGVEHSHRGDKNNYSAPETYNPNEDKIDFQGNNISGDSHQLDNNDHHTIPEKEQEEELEISIGRMRLDLYDQTEISQEEILGWSRTKTGMKWEKLCNNENS